MQPPKLLMGRRYLAVLVLFPTFAAWPLDSLTWGRMRRPPHRRLGTLMASRGPWFRDTDCGVDLSGPK